MRSVLMSFLGASGLLVLALLVDIILDDIIGARRHAGKCAGSGVDRSLRTIKLRELAGGEIMLAEVQWILTQPAGLTRPELGH
jgi:hypothetical protein